MSAISDNHQTVYNRLSDVVRSNDIVKSHPEFDNILSEVGRMLIQCRLHEQVGVRLLHRHNLLRDGEFMIEAAGTLSNGTPALITTRREMESKPLGLIPVIWKSDAAGNVEALEFCEKTIIQVDESLFLTGRTFFLQFHRLVSSHGLEDYLGLCLLGRDVLQHDKEKSLLVENIDVAKVANIVTLKPRASFDRSNAIETVWDFSQATRQRCYPQVCSFCVERSPGHEHAHHRWHEPTGDH
jgi:hypothetical protein